MEETLGIKTESIDFDAETINKTSKEQQQTELNDFFKRKHLTTELIINLQNKIKNLEINLAKAAEENYILQNNLIWIEARFEQYRSEHFKQLETQACEFKTDIDLLKQQHLIEINKLNEQLFKLEAEKKKHQSILKELPLVQDLLRNETRTDSNNSNSTSRPIKIRKKFSRDIINILIQYYNKNKYPTRNELVEIQSKTGKTLIQLANWFNRRRLFFNDNKNKLTKNN